MINDPINKEAFIAENERRSSSWDIRNAPKNYLSLVLAQGGSAFFAFASVWIITRTLGSAGYGSVVAVIAASQVVQVLVNWTSVAVIRYGVDEFIETAKISRIFWVRLIILVPNALLILLASQLWFPLLADWFKLSPEILWLVLVHFAASALWLHIQTSLQAVKMPRLQGLLLMVERAMVFAGLLALLAVGRLEPVWAVTCYAVAPLLMAVTGFWFLRKFIFTSFSVDRQFWKKIFLFSLPLFPSMLTGYFAGSYLDAAFVSKFLSTRDLGIYSVATQINGIFLQLPTLASILLLPMFVNLQKEDQGQRSALYFRHILPIFTLFWGLCCTIVSFVAYFILPLIFGNDFGQTVLPLWILLASSGAIFPVIAGYGSFTSANSVTRIALYASIMTAAANLTFNFLLIPTLGMAGCAWATVITYLIGSAAYAFFLNRQIKMPVSWIFLAVIPAVSGALIFFLTQNPWVSLAICALLSFFIIYIEKTSLRNTLEFLRKFRGMSNAGSRS